MVDPGNAYAGLLEVGVAGEEETVAGGVVGFTLYHDTRTERGETAKNLDVVEVVVVGVGVVAEAKEAVDSGGGRGLLDPYAGREDVGIEGVGVVDLG